MLVLLTATHHTFNFGDLSSRISYDAIKYRTGSKFEKLGGMENIPQSLAQTKLSATFRPHHDHNVHVTWNDECSI
jgi:hypothetical protein